MGLFRKTMSVSTVGIIRYRNKEERATRLAKQTRNAARAGAAGSIVTAKYARDTARNTAPPRYVPEDQPMLAPPGWYPDGYGHGYVRWWDGAQWTEATRAS